MATEERSGSGVDHVGDVTDMIHQREGIGTFAESSRHSQRLSDNFSRFWEKVGYPVLDSPIHRASGIALLVRRFWRINRRGDYALVFAGIGEKSSSGITSDVAPAVFALPDFGDLSRSGPRRI